MPWYSYCAMLTSGQQVKGTLRSQTRREALRGLLQQGYHPLSLEAAEEQAASAPQALRNLIRRVSTGDLAVFTRQLAALLKAGLPVSRALSTVRQQSENRALVRVIEDVEDTLLREGRTLADAMASHPRVFGSVYRSLVRAGEEGGNLVDVLNHMAKFLSQSARLRGQVVGALIYPAFLLILGATAILVLMAFVIPGFQELFKSLGQTLPKPTRALIAVSGFLSLWWWAVLVGLLVGILVLISTLRRPHIRQRVDRFLLRIPVLGPVLLKVEIARASRTLSALVRGGVRILAALRITSDTTRNVAVKTTFGPMVEGVAAGRTLAEMAEKARLYPPLMISLIRTGEETGELPEMLTELSTIYEDEAERAITGAVKLLEPMLIILMGGIIGAIVAAVMLPVFQANSMMR